MSTKTPLTFQEAIKRMNNATSAQDAMNDEQIVEFLGLVEDTGKNILKEKFENPGEYVEEVSEFLQASVMAELLDSDDPKDMAIFLVMMKSSSVFQLILGYAFMYSIGLCAVEELR